MRLFILVVMLVLYAACTDTGISGDTTCPSCRLDNPKSNLYLGPDGEVLGIYYYRSDGKGGFVVSGVNKLGPEQEVTGIYYRGHAISAFIPCSTKEEWWLDGKEQELSRLNAVYASAPKESNLRLFVTARGKFSEKKTNPDYAGIFYLTKLLSHSADAQMISSCDIRDRT